MLIHGSLPVDAGLRALIDASRQADRDDIAGKVAICQALGMTTSALKGNGFTAWLPDMAAFAAVLGQAPQTVDAPWMVHVQDEALATELTDQHLQVTGEAPVYYAFIGF